MGGWDFPSEVGGVPAIGWVTQVPTLLSHYFQRLPLAVGEAPDSEASCHTGLCCFSLHSAVKACLWCQPTSSLFPARQL